ncbi:MAG: cyclic nucleotide-binding domain-containing protein [bacterium]|nr:cyclic nucleotide-binding domain-containing protein [bacterium]
METSLMEHIRHIKTLPVFNEMADIDIASMLKQHEVMGIVSYERTEILIAENNYDRKIFLMLKGKVKITKEIISGDTRKQKNIITVEGKGNFLGEISALTGQPRTASVIAVDRTVCVVIDIAALMGSASSTLLDRVKAKLYPKLFEILCRRLEGTSKTLAQVTQKLEDLDKRILEMQQEKVLMKKVYEKELRTKIQDIKDMEIQMGDFKIFD